MAENNETYLHNDCVSEIKKIFSDVHLSELDDDALVNNLLERSVSVLQVIDHAMSHFVAVNFIGGSVDESYELDGCCQLALEDLCCEGEYPFKLTKSLTLLWLCKRLCRTMCTVSQTLSFLYHLNYLKCIYLHQYLIGDERSPKLKSEFQDIINVCEECLDSTHTTEDVIQYLMLSSYLSAFYYEYEASKTFASRCAQYLNIDVKFCGVLGKCTRFQEKEVANLTVKVNRVVESKDNKTSGNFPLPQIIPLSDDVLLNSVIFSTIEEQSILSNTEQSFILLLCELHRRHYPRDDLTEQQCLAYINTVIRAVYPDSENEIKSSSSWSIATEALFRRSLLEHNSVRKTERALSQLEELSCQFKRTSPSFSERSPSSFFLSRMPSIWTLQAEEVIRSRLNSGDESAELYCSLGDVTNDRQHYLKAWEVSGCKSARAMRSLAVTYMYTDKDYQKAIECFQKSLEINTMQVNVWFTFGCCCLQAKDFVKAENAFRSCVRLDPDISADVKAFHETMHAYHRLLDLQGKYANPQVLSVMVKGVVLNEMDSTGNPVSNLRARLLELFGRVTASIAEESILSIDVQDMIRSSLKDLNELLIDVEKKLN
ncbi:unnamed protein product [Schistosoma margrebowiei]|uniref:Uncharacterized protein n=1 Tax=Schistosoma margrebowiei TaxID=48269 RepID=A0A183LM05_9TREM|nr:unnamed protein product [Schistosoma margrebowiei]